MPFSSEDILVTRCKLEAVFTFKIGGTPERQLSTTPTVFGQNADCRRSGVGFGGQNADDFFVGVVGHVRRDRTPTDQNADD